MKRIIALLIAALLVLSLVACGSDNTSSILTQTVSDTASTETSSKGEESSDSSSSVSSSKNETSSTESTSSAEISSDTLTSNPSSGDSISSDVTTSENTSSGGVSSNEPDTPLVPSGALNPENYHCYSKLSGNKKTIYTALLSAAGRMDSSWIDIAVDGTATAKDVALSFYALQTDHPELFWLPSQYYVKLSTNKVSFLFVGEDVDNMPESSTYLIGKSQKDTMTAKLKLAVDEIKSKVTATDPYEIELQLHDILCDRITYSKDNQNDPLLWTAYGALVNGKAVCEGYARAYQLLLYEFGIKSTLATGVANGEGHMWNIVNIGNYNYHVDVTWDDREEEGAMPFHAYFNLTDIEITKTHSPHVDFTLINDSEFESDHTINYNFALPECRDTSLNYFKLIGATFSKGDEIALADYIISEGGSVEIKFIGEAPNFSVVNSFLQKRKSTLLIRAQISKPPSAVIILEVE